MTSLRLSLLFLALWTVSLADQQNNDEHQLTTPKPPAQKPDKIIISTAESNTLISPTVDRKAKSPGSGFSLDNEMIQRALYVLIGITAIGVLYFLMRAVR